MAPSQARKSGTDCLRRGVRYIRLLKRVAASRASPRWRSLFRGFDETVAADDQEPDAMNLFFPDTNFFLECRKASDLPWHQLSETAHEAGSEIRLIVPPTVINEIERHKTKGNSRNAKRARDASAILRKALTSPGQMTELRNSNPRVVLELPPVVKVDFSQFPNLDSNKPDHWIATEYAEVCKTRPGLQILTDDTLLVLAARSLGFEPVLIPEDWKLPPEKDERDDELDRLREEVRNHRQTSPDMTLSVVGADEDGPGGIFAKIVTFDLPKNEIDAAIKVIGASHPMETNFQIDLSATAMLKATLSGLGTWRPPSDREIDSYKNKDYPAWRNSLRVSLPQLADQLSEFSHEVPFSVSISNNGFVNASHVKLTLTGYDGIVLLDRLSDEDAAERQDQLKPPSPPKPPRGEYVSISSLMATPSPFGGLGYDPRPHIPRDRDPNGFYYTDGRPQWPQEELELTCEAFPHQGEPHVFRFRAVVSDELKNKPRIRVKLEARNLRKPIERYIPISVTFEPGNFLNWLASSS